MPQQARTGWNKPEQPGWNKPEQPGTTQNEPKITPNM